METPRQATHQHRQIETSDGQPGHTEEMYAPASAIRKSQMQKFVRKPTGARLGSEAAPWAKDSEYHLGGMTNTYRTGPKKGQETGTFSLLINPSAGQNKLMPQIIEPFIFGERTSCSPTRPRPSPS